MLYPALRRLVSALKHTPLHPQWLVFLQEAPNLRHAGRLSSGRVLDIGSAEQKPRHYLSGDCEYIPLDYYQTASQWYHTRPQVYATAQLLPFPAASIDTVLLLDVMEHLPDPDAALSKIFRVLRARGRCVVFVPFLYPIHDAPLDFTRWTRHGLRSLAQRHGLSIAEETAQGHAIESAALLTNIALSKTLLDCIRTRNPFALLAIFLPLLIPCINLLAWSTARITPQVDFMPFGYRLVLTKPA